MRAWSHWCHLATAVDWPYMQYLARRHGVTVTQDRPSRSDAPDRFVVLRGDLWLVSDKQLVGDDQILPITELTAGETDTVAAARERCGCGVCATLRPDPGVLDLDAFLDDLRGDHKDAAIRAAWFLGRMSTTTPEALETLVRVGGGPRHFDYDDFSQPIERTAATLPGAWDQLMTLVPVVSPDSQDLALQGMFGLYSAPERTEDERAAYITALRTALDSRGSDIAYYLLRDLEEGQHLPSEPAGQ
jgi:hypothetical protein